MKLKRAKAYKKLMGYLHLNFGFREPYQVLLDEEILLEAVKTKYDVVAGLERTLHAQVKPMITQCTMEHLYRAKNDEAIDIAKQFERRRCGHIPKEGQTLSAFECLASVVDINGANKHRYVVATQKPKLRARLRRIPAVPIIYINRSVMILEPLSPATAAARNNIEVSKLSQGLNAVPVRSDDEANDAEGTKKRKRAKEPNPLSVKKKAPAQPARDADAGPKTRRKRSRRAPGPGDGAGDDAGDGAGEDAGEGAGEAAAEADDVPSALEAEAAGAVEV